MSNEQENVPRPENELLSMTANIVSAFASHNQVAQADLADLITRVHGTLSGLSDGSPMASETGDDGAPLTPAVPIDASVTEDAIICLEDGKSFKTLKRHLRTAYNMSPEEYREKWGLSKDYPMVAPSYSRRRAETAKKIGLGRIPSKRGRKKKA